MRMKPGIPVKFIKYLLVVLGFTSLSTQVIILREFAFIFDGNELVISIFLFFWMTFTGVGAFLKKFILKTPGFFLNTLFFLVFSILPVIMLLCMVWLKDYLVPHGVMLSPGQLFLICLLVIPPYSFLSGWLFVALTQMYKAYDEENKDADKHLSNHAARAYFLESAGSIAAGIITGFVLVYFGQPFQHLILIGLISCLAVILISLKVKRKLEHGMALLFFAGLVILMSSFDADSYYFQKLYPGQEVKSVRNSPYGRIVMTNLDNQENWYENNHLVQYDNDVVNCEESVHYCMLQHPGPKNVLLVSGGLAGRLPEIEKYKVEHIDYVEINPALLEMSEDLIDKTGQETSLIPSDARWYLKTTNKKYDIVLLNLPEPSTLQLNRFYTREFFGELRQVLEPGGFVSLRFAEKQEYISYAVSELFEIINNTIRTSFSFMTIIPGESLYLIASDSLPASEITQLYLSRNIENAYINDYYLDDNSIYERQDQLLSTIQGINTVNTDFSPQVFNRYLMKWLKEIHGIDTDPTIFMILAGLIFIVLLLLFKPASATMVTGAFTGAFTEICILLLYQVIFGYAFYMAGIIFGLFMAGLAAGSYSCMKIRKEKAGSVLLKIQFLIVIQILLLVAAMIILPEMKAQFFIHALLLLLVFLSAFLVSAQFAVISVYTASKFPGKTSVSWNYSADMAGGALGAIVVGLLLIPLAGFVNACYIVAGMNVFSILLFIGRTKLSGNRL